MISGGVAAVSALTVGVNFALKSWVKNGRRQRAEMNVEAVAGPEVGAAGQLELEYLGNAEVDGHHGNGNGNRASIHSFPFYGKENF